MTRRGEGTLAPCAMALIRWSSLSLHSSHLRAESATQLWKTKSTDSRGHTRLGRDTCLTIIICRPLLSSIFLFFFLILRLCQSNPQVVWHTTYVPKVIMFVCGVIRRWKQPIFEDNLFVFDMITLHDVYYWNACLVWIGKENGTEFRDIKNI